MWIEHRDGTVTDGTAEQTGPTVTDFRDLDGTPLVLGVGESLFFEAQPVDGFIQANPRMRWEPPVL